MIGSRRAIGTKPERVRVIREKPKNALVVTENDDLFDTFVVCLVTFDVLQAVLLLVDVTRIPVVRILR